MDTSTAIQYLSRLKIFNEFLEKEFSKLTLSNIIDKIREGKQDPYLILSNYSAYLKSCNISSSTIKQSAVTVKNFFDYYDIDVSPRNSK